MDFDYQGAIKAGYQPDEIADYLAKKNGFDIAGARNAGYSAPEILQHFGVEVSPKKEGILDRAAKAIDPFISDHVPTATLPEVPRQDDVDSDLAKRNANIESRRQSEGIDQLGTANRYLHSFASGAGAATGSGLNYIGRKFGIKSLEDIGNQMQDVAAARTPSNQSFGEQIASGVGSIVSAIGSAAPVTIALESAPVMAGIAGIAETMPMVARGLNFVAKWAPSAFAGAFEAAGNATQTYDDVLRKTGNKDLAQEQADKTFLANLPVNVALNKFGIFGENGSAVKKIFFSTGSEALQEGTQQAISNYFAANPVGEGVTMNAAVGGAVGGAVKTAGVMLEPNAEAKPSPKPDDILNAPDIDTAITTAAGVVSAPLALPLYAGSPLVVFPDGSTMTRAEAEQRRLDSMVQPAETANAPGGSFGQMDEFATLLSDERADLQKRRSTLPTQDEFDDLLKSEQIDLAYLRRDALDKASAERLAQQSPAPALSLQDEAVAKADALTRAQGFDDPAPTAMQLAMQDALARRRPPTEVPREEIPQATVEAAAAANPVATQPTQPDGPSGLDAGSLPAAVEPVTPEATQLNDLARQWDRSNRTGRNIEWQSGAAISNPAFNSIAQEGENVSAHGMAKAPTLGDGLKSLISMINGGIDQNRTLYYDALTNSRGATSGATAGGHAYRDGPFIITFREGLNGAQPTSADITGVLVNPAHSELVAPLQRMFPNLTIRDYNGVADVVSASRSSGNKSESNAPIPPALSKDSAQRLAKQLSNQGFQSDIVPHPTAQGMFAIISTEGNDAQGPVSRAEPQREAGLAPVAPGISQTPAERPVVPEGQGTAGDSDQSTEPLPVKIAASRNPAPIMIRKDIVGAIMRATGGRGIAADMALTITGDSANNVTRLRGLFQRGGVQDMDDIARMVRDEEGFDVKDGAHLEELVRQAAAGDRILSMRGQEEAQSAEEEARHREWLFAQAEKRGIRTRGPRGGLRQFSAVEAEYTALMDKRQATVESKLEERARRAYDAMIEEARSTIGDDRLANELYAAAENLPFDHKARDFYSTVTKHLKEVIYGIQPRDVGLAERSPEGRAGESNRIGGAEADAQRNEEANPPAVPEASAEEGRPALDLVTQTPEELAQKAARENDQAIADRERIKAESEATAPFFSLTQETKPIEVAEQENRARQTGLGLNTNPTLDNSGSDATLARTKDRNEVRFQTPYVGKTGVKLTGYVWPNKKEEYIDRKGEDRVRTVSDWERAVDNLETGRQIVHQFTIELQDGVEREVSAETAARLLGISESTVRSSAKNLLEKEISREKNRQAERADADKIDAIKAADSPSAAIENDATTYSTTAPMIQRMIKNGRGWSFIEDRIERESARNEKYRFLVRDGKYIWSPESVKEGSELERRGWRTVEKTAGEIWPRAFDNLFQTIKTRETDKGVALESRRAGQTDYQYRSDQLMRAFEQMGLTVRRSSSRVSKSEYVEVESPEYTDSVGERGETFKFRVSDHELPKSYAQPDFDVIADGVEHGGSAWNKSGTWVEAIEWLAGKWKLPPPAVIRQTKARAATQALKDQARLKLQAVGYAQDRLDAFDAAVAAGKVTGKKTNSGTWTLTGWDVNLGAFPGESFDLNKAISRAREKLVAVVEARKLEAEGAPTPNSRELGSQALNNQDAGAVSLRADESGQLKEPAQSGSGAGSNIMLSRKIDAGNTTASKGLQQYRLRVAQQARDKFLSVFKGTDALDIRVVNSRDEIHEDTRPSPYADGVYYDDKGRIYLIADNITDRAHATRILLHEAVGHYGLSTMMGERFQPLKEAALGIHADGDVTNVQPGDKNWATIEAVRRDYPEVSDDVAAQEVLARMAETPGPTPTLLARAMFHVRSWLRDMAEKMGIKWDWKPEEIRNAIGMANDYMRRGDNLPSEGMGGERGLVYSSMSEPIDAAAGPRPAFVANPEHDGQGPERPNASGSRQSIGKLNDEGKPPLESRATTQPASTWDIEPSSPWKDFVYKFQDKYVDLKDAINAIRDSGAMIGDAVNTYLKEELYHKRVGKRTADFFEGEFKPLLITMQAMGVKREEFEEYLHARHATEANALIRDRGGMDDGGSGMTDKDAADYMAKLTPNKRKQYEALAKRTDAILAKTRETLVEYGLESKETIDGWAKMFAHYVPLHREDMAEGQGIGQGFSVKGSASKHRTGSSRNVADILGNIAQQRDRAIVRGEKNRVAVSLFGLAYTNPNPDIWEAGVVPMIQTVDKNNQIVSVPDPMYKSRDNVIVARLKDSNGQVHDRAIVFNESNARALRMAAALKNLDAANLEGLIGLSGKITRFMAAMSTQYNPVFMFINFARDFQSSAINLSSTPLAGKQKEVMGHALSALHGIYADLRDHRAGRTPTSKWEKLYEEMQLEGGTTGYREMFATANDRTAEQIDKLLDPEWWTKTGWGKVVSAGGLLKAPEQFLVSGPGKALVQWLSDANETAENAMRLAVFKTALDHGLSKEQAASLAKNISVNFNRKGQVGAQMNAAYAFFNAATQGTARIYETLKGPAGKQIIVGGLLVGVAQAMMMAAAGFDDDEPKDFIKERNLIIPLGWISGKKDFFSIPMPLGFHVLPSLGRISAEFAMRGFRKPGKAMGDMVSLLAEAFNPIGSAGVSLQTLMPTPLDPLTALAENKDWTGKTIAKEDFNKLSPTPGHSRAKDTATWFGKSISEALNTISGGTKYTPGWMSPTPDQIDYLIGQATGGVGREVMKAEQTISSTVTGEDLPMHKVPLLGRVYGTTEGQSNEASRFYDNLKKLNEHEAEIKGRRENKEDAAGYIRENPESRLVAYANSTERVVSDLRKRKRKLIEDGASKERIKLIEMQMAARMARFNKRVAEVEQ